MTIDGVVKKASYAGLFATGATLELANQNYGFSMQQNPANYILGLGAIAGSIGLIGLHEAEKAAGGDLSHRDTHKDFTPDLYKGWVKGAMAYVSGLLITSSSLKTIEYLSDKL